jgi:hypothetical protein
MLVGAVCLAPSIAAAQTTPNDASRRALLEQAERAYAHGDHAAALRLAQRAGETRMTPSVLLLIAQEHNALGHTLDALAAAESCLRVAEADPSVPQRREILSLAGRLRDALRARVSYVTVRVAPEAPEGLRVFVQGAELAAGQWGVAQAALPGATTVVASAPTGSFESRVMLDAGGASTVDVVLTPRRAPEVTPEPQATRGPASNWLLERGGGAAPWIVLGTGGALLATSVVFFVLRSGARDDRDALCRVSVCSADDLRAQADYDQSARNYSIVANVTLGAGIVAAAAGTAWILIARRSARPSSALRWQLAPTRDGLSLGLGGTF